MAWQRPKVCPFGLRLASIHLYTAKKKYRIAQGHTNFNWICTIWCRFTWANFLWGQSCSISSRVQGPLMCLSIPYASNNAPFVCSYAISKTFHALFYNYPPQQGLYRLQIFYSLQKSVYYIRFERKLWGRRPEGLLVQPCALHFISPR